MSTYAQTHKGFSKIEMKMLLRRINCAQAILTCTKKARQPQKFASPMNLRFNTFISSSPSSAIEWCRPHSAEFPPPLG